MNILEVMTKFRDDIKSWVTVNLNALNSKIDQKTVPIDSELNESSENPVQNKTITKAIKNIPIFSGDYTDLRNAPNIVEDDFGDLNIADENGNIIFRVNEDGVHTTAINLNHINVGNELENKVDKIEGKGLSTNDYTDADKAKLALINSDMAAASIDSFLSLDSNNPVKNKAITTAIYNHTNNTQLHIKNIADNESDDLLIIDAKGNLIASIDKDGLHTTNLSVGGNSIESIIDLKFNSIEDSLVNNTMQEVLRYLPKYNGGVYIE